MSVDAKMPAISVTQPALATCNACAGDCLETCFNDAIQSASTGGVFVDAARCAGCGACIPVCGLGLLRLDQGVARIISTAP